MTGLAISPAGTTSLPERAAKPVDGELREAAQQFEAIPLRQMLASARNTDFGGNDLFGERTTPSVRCATRVSPRLLRNGSARFAAAIEHQLARFLPEGDD